MPEVPTSEAVLAVNVGSSSVKYGAYGRQGTACWHGEFDGLRGDAAVARALAGLVAEVGRRGVRPVAVVHRIVHGGDAFCEPCLLTPPVCAALSRLVPLAPLHQPHNLAGVAVMSAACPDVPQIGCFDTAFHTTLPAVERRLPLPRVLSRQGLRRYGFHGLAYAQVTATLQQVSARGRGRWVLLHLGSGASACAVHDGHSMATSMGFSALDGLLMGTRCGTLDPGALLYLMRQGLDADAMERLLYRESGLLGVSGLSADMKALRAADDPRATEAIALFTHRVIREVGALTAVLGGIDGLAFSGGIGEHDATLRADVVGALDHLGIRLDTDRNEHARADRPQCLQSAGSTAEVWLVPADEGRHAADAAFAWLDEGPREEGQSSSEYAVTS